MTDAMQPTPPRRRSTRCKRKRNEDQREEASAPMYPDGVPSNELERTIARLDKEAFPILSYGRIDDIVVYSLFASKRCPEYYRAMKPSPFYKENDVAETDGDGQRPILESEPSFTTADALAIAYIFNRRIPRGTMPTKDALRQATNEIIEELGQFFQESDGEILQQ
jgi:hypothetical protein